MQINKPEKTKTTYSHILQPYRHATSRKEYCCAPLLVGLNAHHIFYKTPSKFAPYEFKLRYKPYIFWAIHPHQSGFRKQPCCFHPCRNCLKI